MCWSSEGTCVLVLIAGPDTRLAPRCRGYAPYLQLSQTQRDIEAALKVLDDAAAKFPTAAVIFIYKGQVR